MGGVDLSDQVLQYYAALRRCLKWWKKLFFHLFNLMLVNAYKLFQKYGDPPKKKSHLQFRCDIVKSLIESSPLSPKPSRRGGKKPQPLERLQGMHLPQHIPAKVGAKKLKVQRDCVACNVEVKKRVGHQRHQTIYQCHICQVPLCVPKCFEIYHTIQNYKAYLHE
jgi:hypothetical protein